MQDELLPLSLTYGHGREFQGELLKKQVLVGHAAPGRREHLSLAVARALDQPIDFPSLASVVTPGDRAVLVVDRETPDADVILAEVWKRLSEAGLDAGDVTLLHPATWRPIPDRDPRKLIPVPDRDRLARVQHDPTSETGCSYLASTASGERVYLSRELTDADVVIVIGPLGYDPLLGVRGTASSLYPGLSDVDALRRSQGQGHEELGPLDPRPMRQIVDEVGWLLGVQFAIAVVPDARAGTSDVLAGQADSVLREGRKRLEESWLIRSEERAELVVVSVPADAAGHDWEQVSAAIDVGRRLVERNGRVLVLSELDAAPGPGLSALRSVREPRDALQVLRRTQPPDLQAAWRIASAADWANIALLSRLPADVVEDLFLIPMTSEDEARRWLANDDMISFVEAAQHVAVINTH